MADVHNKETRSKNMRAVRSKDTKAELTVRKFLHSKGFRFRKNYKKYEGTPDIVLPKYNTIIDIRGCFWHKHKDCKFGDAVNTTAEVYIKKRNDAVKRDLLNEANWRIHGWNVIVVWECELEPRKKTSDKRIKILNSIVDQLRSGNTSN